VLASALGPIASCEKSAPEPNPSTSTAAPSSAAAKPATPPPAETPPSTTAASAPAEPKSLPAPSDVGAAPADAKKTPSGLAIKVLKPGTGKDHPGPDDKVKVDYTGWTTDGKMFDSSVVRGEPTSFKVSGVIKGWTEGLQLMTIGEKARLWIPGKLAYGDTPAQPGMPAGMLVFDVELLDFTAGPKPPAVPPDVKAAPASAKKTESGLAYRVLQKGTGTKHPAATDQVTVHYTGWTPDGKMFDSSVTRGEPTSFGLNGVIKGWTEGVQLMVEGEKTRFWIPSNLAYGDNPGGGRPGGMLVFDIELLKIK
jgi:peptidylprolyl isomerase